MRWINRIIVQLPERNLWSWVRSLANCSGGMHVHWGAAFVLLGDAGVDSGFIRVFTFCLFPCSALNEYSDAAFLGVFVEGVYDRWSTRVHIHIAPNSGQFVISCKLINNEQLVTHTTVLELFRVYRRCKIQSPRVVGHRIFPVDKTFGCLTNSRTWNDKLNYS